MKYDFSQLQLIGETAENLKETLETLDIVRMSTQTNFTLRSGQTGSFSLSRQELLDVLSQRRDSFLRRLNALGIDVDFDSKVDNLV